jgi:predicted Zn-dependent protease
MLLLAFPAVFYGCHKNAITGRKQLQFIPETELQSMAATEYRTFLTSNKVLSNVVNKDAEMVRRVGQRISTAVTDYYTAKGLGSELSGYQWEYNLVDSKDVNAWCMPGGKIVVYTGLLPVTQNEAALAVVMGHEIAHALARHGNERISQAYLAQGVQVLGNVALSKNEQAVNVFNSLYGVGAQVGVLLPYGRKQELEADKLGLIFAAMSGYNPQEAIPLWQRMEKMSGGNKPPEFLSTHPTEERRIRKLEEQMEEALKYYRPVSNPPKAPAKG